MIDIPLCRQLASLFNLTIALLTLVRLVAHVLEGYLLFLPHVGKYRIRRDVPPNELFERAGGCIDKSHDVRGVSVCMAYLSWDKIVVVPEDDILVQNI